jgi:hypothetical protein
MTALLRPDAVLATGRTFANARARSYCREDLAVSWARLSGQCNLRHWRALINLMSRDDIIADLRHLVMAKTGGNGVRAAYIAERHARLIDRAVIRQWAEEIVKPGF